MSRAHALVLLAPLAGCGVPDFVPPPARPEIVRFEVSPFQVEPGAAVTVRWATRGADAVTLEGLEAAPRPVPPEGSRAIVADTSRALTLTARGPGGAQRARAALVVEAPGAPVRIDAFTASPRRVRAGDPVQVQWRTTGARAVRLLAAGVDQIVPAVGNRILRLAPGPLRLRAEGAPAPVEATVELTEVPTRPVIESFFADPASVTQGDVTRLRARVDAFERVRVFATDGDGLRTPIFERAADDVAEQPTWMNIDTPPIGLGTEAFTLVVDSALGRAEDVALVTGTRDPAPGVDLLTVTPTVGGPGGDVQVRWRTRGMTDLYVALGNTIQERNLPASGDRTYTLRADADQALLSGRSGFGRLTEQTPLLVRLDWPAIDSLVASRADDARIFVSWLVTGGERVEVRLDGALVHTSTQTQDTLTLEATDTRTVGFDAVNAAGRTRARRAVPARTSPDIRRFEVETATVAVGRWVWTEWETTDAARVTLEAFGVQQRVPASGRLAVLVAGRGTQTLRLVALGADGRFDVQDRLVRAFDAASGPFEVEPNDTFAAAGGPFGVLPQQVRGELALSDPDVYRIEDARGRVEISTGVAPDCPEGAALTLWRDLGPAGALQIARVQPPGACPALTESTAAGMSGWPGPWFVRLEHPGAPAPTLPYRLLVTPTTPRCGDGVVDALEDCDPGAPVPDDECSVACTFEGLDDLEPNDDASLARPWLGPEYRGSLWPDDEDWLTFTTTTSGPQALRLRGEGPALSARLQLWTPDERRLADSGWALDPGLSGPALVLPAGTYRLRVLAGDGVEGPVRGRYRLER